MAGDVTTVDAYLAGLEPERRAVVGAVREAINAALPDGYEENIGYGMLVWSIPLERYADTYNGQPLGLVALAAQKRYYSLYLTGVYADSAERAEFRRRWEATGKKLDMGKSCVRFRKLDDLDLGLVTEFVQRTPVDEFIARYERSRSG